MTMKTDFERMAREAKRRGYPLGKVIPEKEPFRSIFEAEYNRFKPRKSN